MALPPPGPVLMWVSCPQSFVVTWWVCCKRRGSDLLVCFGKGTCEGNKALISAQPHLTSLRLCAPVLLPRTSRAEAVEWDLDIRAMVDDLKYLGLVGSDTAQTLPSCKQHDKRPDFFGLLVQSRTRVLQFPNS